MNPAKYIFSFHTQTITKGSIPHPSAAMAEIPLTSLRAEKNSFLEGVAAQL